MTRAKIVSKIITNADLDGDLDVDGTTNLDVVDIDGAVDMATTLAVTGVTTLSSKVGILGTNDLGLGLHIKEGDSGVTSVSTDADQLVIENNAESGISILAPNDSASRIAFGDSDNNKISQIYYNHTSNFMSVDVNNAERLRIDSSGNVGISSSSPVAKLDVNSGDIAISSTQASDNGDLGEFQFWNTTNAGSGAGTSFVNDVASIQGQMEGTGNNSGGSLHFYTKTDGGAKTQQMTITGAGKVGIGVSSPQELLHLKDGDIAVGNGTASNNAVIGRVGFSTDSSNSRFIGMESFRGSDAANADLRFHTFGGDGDNGERMRIDSSGNVGIGTTSIQASAVGKTLQSSGSLVIGGTIQNHQTSKAVIEHGGNSTNIRSYGASAGTGQLTFTTGGGGGSADTERMRILADGRTIIGHTAAINSSILGISNRNATSDRMFAVHNAGGTSGYFNQIAFRNNADSSTIGEIVRVNDASVSYNTTSDYRLKTAVNYDWDATTRLKQLKPARFKWIVDGDDAVPVDGFLAHEAQAVVPEAVTGTKDEVDDDGNPVMQGIDQSKLVPLLVKSLQEALTEIDTLKTRVIALENA